MTQSIEKQGARYELGYWAIRGLGQPIRYLFAYLDEPLSEVRVGVDPKGNILEDESLDWDALKPTLPMTFPNLPYLIDKTGDEPVYLSQSNAILRYLGRRFELYGDTPNDVYTIDLLQEEAYDYRNAIVKAAYTLGGPYEAAYEAFCTEAVPRFLDRFEHYLAGREKSHFVGERVCFVDFVLYELIWQTTLMVPGAITEQCRPSLNEFLSTFGHQPAIAAYEASDHYIERPINSHWASFT